MSAADQIALAEKWEAAHRKLVTVLGWLLVAAALLTLGWCSGRSHERTITTAAHADSLRKAQRQIIAVSQQAIRADSVTVARATAHAVQTHDSSVIAAYKDSLARARAAAGHVRIVSDTSVSIHDTVATVPHFVVVQLLDDAATLKADSTLQAKQADEIAAVNAKSDGFQLQLTDTERERDAWHLTANVDAAQLAVSQPKHRLGFKSGLVAGAGILLAILHFAH